MILVLFFFIIILISLLIILTSILWLQIDIKNFRYYKEDKIEKKTDNYEIIVNVYVFKKIKLFEYLINSKKNAGEYFKKIKNKIDISTLTSFVNKNIDISNIDFIEIEKLDLNLKVGTENVILTTGIVTLSNILISIFLPKYIIKYDKEKYNYEVKPIYENKNRIDFFLETKIRIKLLSLIQAFKSYAELNKKI